MVRVESGGDGLPIDCCFIATMFGHHCSVVAIVVIVIIFGGGGFYDGLTSSIFRVTNRETSTSLLVSPKTSGHLPSLFVPLNSLLWPTGSVGILSFFVGPG